MAHPIWSRRWPWLTAAGVVLAFYISTAVDLQIGGPDQRPPGTAEDIAGLAKRSDVNVLFILIDTLRADHLGAYGYSRDTSPVIDHLASRGVRFARQLAQSSWTKCSMASLWTSLYPMRTGVTRFEHVIPDEARLPAEMLQEAGFVTAGIFRNGWVEGYFGFDQGFETYTRPLGRAPGKPVRRKNPTLSDAGTDLNLVDAASEFIRIHSHERWFLYLHLMDVHEYLYDEDTALFGVGFADIYDNAIRHTDLVLNQLFVDLAEQGHLDDTVIAIASDHGEAFGERGHEGHARRVYRETTEVPFILSFPFRLDPGVVVERRTRNVDIWPTLLDLLGLPAMHPSDGVSRRPEILAAAAGEPLPADATPAYAHLDQTWGRRKTAPLPTVAVAENGFRYVVSHDSQGVRREELFDASSDSGELRNVLGEHPETSERLRGLAQSYLKTEPPWGGEVEALELDEVQLQQLRALGYQIP